MGCESNPYNDITFMNPSPDSLKNVFLYGERSGLGESDGVEVIAKLKGRAAELLFTVFFDNVGFIETFYDDNVYVFFWGKKGEETLYIFYYSELARYYFEGKEVSTEEYENGKVDLLIIANIHREYDLEDLEVIVKDLFYREMVA